MIFDDEYAVCKNDDESDSGDGIYEKVVVFKMWGNKSKYDNESGKISRNE